MSFVIRRKRANRSEVGLPEVALLVGIVALILAMASMGLAASGSALGNACDGAFRTYYGRCESGVASCIVPNVGVGCTTTVTFSTPFASLGPISLATNFAGVTTTNIQSSVLGVMNTNTTKWAVHTQLVEFRNDTSDRVWVRAPIQMANLATPTFFYVNVITAASPGSTFILQCGTGIAPVLWINLTSVSVSTVGPKQGVVPTNPSGWGSCNSQLLGTLRVETFGGDNATVGAFAQIEAVVARTFNVVFICSYTNLTPSGFTLIVTTGFPLPETAQTIPCAWKAVSETG